MIPIELEDALTEELKTALSGLRLKNINGELVPLNIYPHTLPAKKHEDDEEHFPYLVIRLQNGEDPNETDSNSCKILFVTGVIDESEDLQGHRDAANVINKVYQYLYSKRVVRKYRVEHPFNWSLPEEDTYPYFFAGAETNWQTHKTTQGDELI